jgi:hypothetical protein
MVARDCVDSFEQNKRRCASMMEVPHATMALGVKRNSRKFCKCCFHCAVNSGCQYFDRIILENESTNCVAVGKSGHSVLLSRCTLVLLTIYNSNRKK